MNYTAFQLDAFQTCAFQAETDAGEFRVVGFVPSKLRNERKFLVTVDGNRFMVPESELAQWVQDRTDDAAGAVIAKHQAPKKTAKAQKQEVIGAAAAISIDAPRTDDYRWIHAMIADANRIMAQLRREADDADEDDIEMLLMTL